jgi:phage gp36-like protein
MNMNWTSIMIDDLQDAKAAAIVDALRTKALADSQGDPTLDIIAGVVARVRAEIRAWKANDLDVDATKVPRDLKSLTCRMILRELMSRLQLPLNEDEREEQHNDLHYLERIASGAITVDAPDNPSSGEVQAAAVSPSITADDRIFNRSSQGGL